MSDLRARLRLDADASGLVAETGRGERAVKGLGEAAEAAGRKLGGADAGADRLAAGSRRAAGAADQLEDQLTQSGAAAGRAAVLYDRAGDQAQRFETRARGGASGAALLTAAMGAIGGVQVVQGLTDAAFAVGGLEMGLGAVTGGTAGAAAALGFVYEEADRLGLVAQTTARSFLSLAAATNETSLAGQDTRDIWLAQIEAGLALGRSNEQIQRGLLATEQVASKGVLTAEELRGQLAEAIPGAVQIAARALGVTTVELNRMLERGEVVASEFLPAFAAELRSTYGPAIEDYLTSPLGRARVELGQTGTALTTLQAIGGEGFLEGVVEGLGSLNDELGEASSQDKARALGEALGEGMGAAAEAIAWAVENLDALVATGQLVAGGALTRWLVQTAFEARAAAAAYVLKGGAAKAASIQATAGLAVETTAARTLTGAVVAAAEAQVLAARAVANKMAIEAAAARSAYAYAAADAAAAGSTRVRALRAAEAEAALRRLMAANAAAAASSRQLAAAELGLATASTRTGQAMGVLRAGASGLLGLLGGPWVVGLGAAAAALVFLHNEMSDAREEQEDFDAETRRLAQAHDEADRAARASAAAAGVLEGATGSAADEAAGSVSKIDALADAYGRLAAEAWEAARAQAQQAFHEARADRMEAERDLATATAAGTSAPMNRADILTGSVQPRIGGPDPLIAQREAALETRRRQEQEAWDSYNQVHEDATDPEAMRGYGQTSGGGATGGGASGGSDSGRDPADVLADLQQEALALRGHAAAALLGERALRAWEIAEAGRQAVAQAGVDPTSAMAAAIREQAEETERLAQLDDRVTRASKTREEALEDTAALRRRAAAALEGREALEQLRVSEAGVQVLRDAGVRSLSELNGLERDAVEAAIAAAEARERQAIATERAEAAGASIEDLDRRIAAEERRTAAVGQGVEAEVEYARAEFVRQEIERAGLEVTDEAAALIREKAEALFAASAAADAAQEAADLDEELRLLRLTNREREIAVRIDEHLARLMLTRVDLTREEQRILAETMARREVEALETASAIGKLSETMRQQFIESGRLGFDEIGEYAEQRLREAVYDALLARPIDIVIRATVGGLENALGSLLGGGQGGLGGLLGGGKAGAGGLGGLLGGSGGLGGLFGGSGAGGLLGGLRGMLGTAGMIYAVSQLGGSGASWLTGMFGGDAGQQRRASQTGSWLGAIPGAIAGMMDEGDRPQSMARLVVRNGQLVVDQTRTEDGGPGEEISALAAMIASSVNGLAQTLGLDLSAVEDLMAGVGYVRGRDSERLGQGYYGGESNQSETASGLRESLWDAGFHDGYTNSNVQSAEELAQRVIRETILRAVEAGAGELTDAERRLLDSAADLEEAVAKIQASRGLSDAVEDEIRRLTDPAAFEREKALEAIEANYQALKDEAEELIAAGLISGDILARLQVMRDLQIEEALDRLGEAADEAADAFIRARPALERWLDRAELSDYAPLNPLEQRNAAFSQYEDMLARAQAGDEDALSEITAYADRLLAADRAATSSAEARALLYAEVMEDIRRLTLDPPSDDDLLIVCRDTTAAVKELGPIICDPIVEKLDEVIDTLGDLGRGGGPNRPADDGLVPLAANLTQMGDKFAAGLARLEAAIVEQTEAAGDGSAATRDALQELIDLSRELRTDTAAQNALVRQVVQRVG